MEKDVFRLDDIWQFKEFPESARRMSDLEKGGWMKAAVPASIYTCLIEAGQIEQANLITRPEDFQWVSEKSWIFRKQFDVSQDMLEKERIRLVFEGLDTVCQIWINGKLLGKTDNMFIPHVFDITNRLVSTGNVLTVKFSPALRYAEQLMQRYGRLSEHHFGDVRRSYIRKAQYQFGSVMGPALVGCGIFRSVRIEGVSIARIENLHVRTVDCNQHYADIRIGITAERINKNNSPLHGIIRMISGGLDITQKIEFSPHEEHHTTLLHIDRPILWWPNGYGVQHLYRLQFELYQGRLLLDTAETNIGIRSIHLDRNADDAGTKFQFIVNEQPVQIKGANWMPLSMMPGNQQRDDYKMMLQQAADAHFNMLRVWGGGYYESSDFYQLCDESGILVWQDFMFASAYYPDRQWFKGMIHEEIRTLIETLRNHPSLAIWCGNSRIDSLHETGRLGKGRKFYGKYIYHALIPELLRELDPDREYIPTTPISDSHPAVDHEDPTSGTTHNWYLWNQYGDRNDYESAPSLTPRFVVEHGLQSLPDMRTVEVFGNQEAIEAGSYALEKHNYQPGGQQRIARYVSDDFVPSSDLSTAVWQSQVTQARVIKGYIEYLRTHRAVNSGSLVWTYNEPAPSIGFSIVDIFGRPKAAYFYAKRFFSPILVTLTPTGFAGTHYLTVINDSQQRITAELECRLLKFNGTVSDCIRFPVALSPYSLSPLYPVPKSFFHSFDSRKIFVHLRLSKQESVIAENFYFFKPDKYLYYPSTDVDLEIHAKTGNLLKIDLQANKVIRDLYIVPIDGGRLSDNFITLLPGCRRRIEMIFDGQAPSIRTPLQILCAGQA